MKDVEQQAPNGPYVSNRLKRMFKKVMTDSGVTESCVLAGWIGRAGIWDEAWQGKSQKQKGITHQSVLL